MRKKVVNFIGVVIDVVGESLHLQLSSPQGPLTVKQLAISTSGFTAFNLTVAKITSENASRLSITPIGKPWSI
jgi:hypothetical protein